jgi:diguanylate cyclase (GGDEF)-like protein
MDGPAGRKRTGAPTRKARGTRLLSAPAAAPDTDLYALLLEMSGEPALLHSAGRILVANEAAALLLGLPSAGALVGRPVADFLPPSLSGQAGSLLAAYPKRRSVVASLTRADGDRVDAWIGERACVYRGEPATQVVVRTQPVGGEPNAGAPDMLTDLPNRRQFKAHLQAAIDRAIRNRHQVWVLYVDFDRFAVVNASHGHASGDRVLAEAAQRLQACVRKTDLVASPGGDEFLIALEGTTDLEGARIVAGRALESLARPFQVGAAAIEATACIGISVAPADGTTPDVLLQNVDVAMWQAKSGSRNRFEVYSPQLSDEHRRSALARADTERKLASLTPREQEVLEHLVAGEANKMIAWELGASMRTIEHHRARIMSKLQAGSLPELVRMVLGRRDA